jgi:hypothetical protein
LYVSEQLTNLHKEIHHGQWHCRKKAPPKSNHTILQSALSISQINQAVA